MSSVPPPNPPGGDSPSGDEESAEFVLVPRNNPDGTPPKPTAESKRRTKATIYHAQQLAKQHGLDLVGFFNPDNSLAPQTERSKRIRAAANPEMAEAAAGFQREVKEIELTTPDGSKVVARHVTTRLNAHAALKGTLEALGELMAAPFKWSGRIALKCGKWLKADAQATSEAEAGNS